MIKLLVIIGTRPEAIKMSPLILELKKNEYFNTIVVSTGQHKEILDEVFEFFKIEPEYSLKVFSDNQSLSKLSSVLLEKIEPILISESPDAVIVHGDTVSAFVAALSAFYQKIKIFHVEAGLRTNDLYSPHPEEYFRLTIDSLSDLLFAPTQSNYDNLIREGIDKNKIFITGNTIVDTFEYTLNDSNYDIYKFLEIPENKKLILLTMHRRENLGQPMHEVFSAIKEIADEFEDVFFIFPIHPNPIIKSIAEQHLKNHGRVLLTKPLPFQLLHRLMAESYLIMTDSGGIQEEAAFLDKPLIVLRKSTEREEIISRVNGVVVFPRKSVIVNYFKIYYEQQNSELKHMRIVDYSEYLSSVSQRIVSILEEKLSS